MSRAKPASTRAPCPGRSAASPAWARRPGSGSSRPPTGWTSRPRTWPRALASGHSRTVGIVLPTLRSWYFSEFASGASEILSSGGIPGRTDQPRCRLRRSRRRLPAVPATVPRARCRARPRRAAVRRHHLDRTARQHRRGLRTGSGHRHRLAADQRAGHLRRPPGGRAVDRRAPARAGPPGHRDLRRTDAGASPTMTSGSSGRPGCWTCSGRPGSRSPTSDVITPGDCHAVDGERAMEELLARSGHDRQRSSATPTSWPSAPWRCCAGTDCAARRRSRSPASTIIPMSRLLGADHRQPARPPAGDSRRVRAGRRAGRGARSREPARGDDLQVELIVRETTAPAPSPS